MPRLQGQISLSEEVKRKIKENEQVEAYCDALSRAVSYWIERARSAERREKMLKKEITTHIGEKDELNDELNKVKEKLVEKTKAHIDLVVVTNRQAKHIGNLKEQCHFLQGQVDILQEQEKVRSKGKVVVHSQELDEYLATDEEDDYEIELPEEHGDDDEEVKEKEEFEDSLVQDEEDDGEDEDSDVGSHHDEEEEEL